MNRLRIPGFWAMIVLLAGLLTLAGCNSGTSTPTPTTEQGAAISLPWDAGLQPTSSGSGFTITNQAAAASPNPGGQTVAYAASQNSTAPTSDWQAGLTFIRSAGTYYVFARTEEKTVGTVTYTAGSPVMSAEPITLQTIEPPTEETISWAERVAFTIEDEGDSFRVRPAAEAGSGTVEYQFTVGDDPAVLNSTRWTTSTNMRFSTERYLPDISTQQYYMWARRQASGSGSASEPISRRITLQGPELTPAGTLTLESTGVTSTGATVSIQGSLTREFDIEGMVIQYGLSPSATSGTGSGSVWPEPPNQTAGTVITIPFTGLSPSTAYYLYARTKSTTNFEDGPELRLSENIQLTTRGSQTSADSLASQLNAMYPNSATPVAIAQDFDSTVILYGVGTTNEVLLNGPLDIPSGVRLKIREGKTLRANLMPITGSGTIDVERGGTLYTNAVSADLPIVVSAGGYFYMTPANTPSSSTVHPIVGYHESSTDAAPYPQKGILNLIDGSIAIVFTGNGWRYTLAGNAVIYDGGDPFELNLNDTFYIKNGAVLTVPHINVTPPTPPAPPISTLTMAGHIEVELGGELVLPETDSYIGLNNTTAYIRVFAGGGVTLGIPSTPPSIPPNPSNSTFITAVVGTDYPCHFDLDTRGQLDIRRPLVADDPDHPIIRFTVRGNSLIGENGLTIGTAGTPQGQILEVASGVTLTAPGGISINSGSLTLNNGGTLELAGSNSTLAVTSGATLDITYGAVLKGPGRINVTGTGTSARGTLIVPALNFGTGTIDSSRINREEFNGGIEIRGANGVFAYGAKNSSIPYIGTTNAGFSLAGSAVIRIAFENGNPVYTLSGGTATVNGLITAPAVITNRFVVASGGTLSMASNGKYLNVTGTTLEIREGGTITGAPTSGSGVGWATINGTGTSPRIIHNGEKSGNIEATGFTDGNFPATWKK